MAIDTLSVFQCNSLFCLSMQSLISLSICSQLMSLKNSRGIEANVTLLKFINGQPKIGTFIFSTQCSRLERSSTVVFLRLIRRRQDIYFFNADLNEVNQFPPPLSGSLVSSIFSILVYGSNFQALSRPVNFSSNDGLRVTCLFYFENQAMVNCF
ncbi:hypothetical protein FGO68_gene1862 [Halteria grandinella]|uniref:Uncharacterized protein n=1 Tax=Halteria grandinella TaxID=5974 RepID=A0A8J8T7B5_HALGN|nr:hypothetical protein FGO68_gene1862 [Halteria grandinella]